MPSSRIPGDAATRRRRSVALLATGLVLLFLFAGAGGAQARPRSMTAPSILRHATQLVLVTTADWDSTSGQLRRFARAHPGAPWHAVADAVPVVLGRTGLATGSGFGALAPDAPHKHEGDGRSPAGVFPLTGVFGFAPPDSMHWVRMPYTELTAGTDCVDDTASAHYNDVVDRSAVPSVDWASAEHMRAVAQYRIGVVVGYNAGATRVPGRGSCIFLHIWGGPGSTTAGCTAFDAGELERVVAWLDPKARPVLVQLPEKVYRAVRGGWGL